jgi:hypothetical protein
MDGDCSPIDKIYMFAILKKEEKMEERNFFEKDL